MCGAQRATCNLKSAMSNPWILAARLKTLPASIAPVLVGTALAARAGAIDLLVFAATLMTAVLLQVGANYANDVFDYLKGADKARIGPTRVTQSGLLTPRQMLIGTAAVFGAATLLGIYLVYVGGLPIVIIGVCAIVAALAYTAGPFPLAYHGLGDVFAFLFFGVVAVAGTYLLQTGTIDALVLLASLPTALLVTNIIVVNNLRDIDTDRDANKRTLAVRIGDRRTRLEYVLFLALAYLTPPALWIGGLLGPAAMLPWLSLPVGVALARNLWRTPRSPALNPILGRTAQFNLLFSALFAAGILF
jgi:1,4-dihydroxy-2-naphthoate octaprenyltransferase